MPVRVTIDHAARTATLQMTSWSATFPISDLPAQLRFYRRLWARQPNHKGQLDLTKPGPWAGFYEETVRALECAVREAFPP